MRQQGADDAALAIPADHVGFAQRVGQRGEDFRADGGSHARRLRRGGSLLDQREHERPLRAPEPLVLERQQVLKRFSVVDARRVRQPGTCPGRVNRAAVPGLREWQTPGAIPGRKFGGAVVERTQSGQRRDPPEIKHGRRGSLDCQVTVQTDHHHL